MAAVKAQIGVIFRRKWVVRWYGGKGDSWTRLSLYRLLNHEREDAFRPGARACPDNRQPSQPSACIELLHRISRSLTR